MDTANGTFTRFSHDANPMSIAIQGAFRYNRVLMAAGSYDFQVSTFYQNSFTLHAVTSRAVEKQFRLLVEYSAARTNP